MSLLGRVFIFLWLSIVSICCLAQSSKEIYIRFKPVSGGNVPFVVSSMKHYHDGIKYEGWTSFDVFFVDSADFNKKWDLYFWAEDEHFQGDYHQLDLDYLEVEVVESSAGGVIDPSQYPGFGESQAKRLLSNADYGTHKIKVSYRCGTNKELIGNPPDYYNLILVFEVRPSP